MNDALKARSDGVPYKRNCADCLLQGTKNAPPSPAPRKAAISGEPVSQRTLAFLIPGTVAARQMDNHDIAATRRYVATHTVLAAGPSR